MTAIAVGPTATLAIIPMTPPLPAAAHRLHWKKTCLDIDSFRRRRRLPEGIQGILSEGAHPGAN